METAVLIATVIGILLFVISYLKFAYEGFRFHFVTGLLALIPVLNLITLPTLWDRTNRILILGAIGLLLAVAGWFLGAGNTYQAYMRGGPSQITSPLTSDGSSIGANSASDKGKLFSTLPSKALYRLDFESASPDQVDTFTGRIVRITASDHSITDGRVQSVTPSSVFIEQSGDGQIAYEMMRSNIKSIEVMVRKAAR